MKKHFLGCKRDLFDKRDFRFVPKSPLGMELDSIDLSTTPFMPKVFNQGSLGSCTANAIGNCYLFVRNKEGKVSKYVPSRLFIYYNERKSEGNVGEDSGAMIRTGMKVINKYGACIDNLCPYKVKSFSKKPSEEAYKNGLDFQSILYKRMNNTLFEMQSCLAEGYPFVLGIDLYENFENEKVSKTGIVDMPEGSYLGGHAVMAVGYSNINKKFKIMNSWGSDWGDKGYFYLPYEYITNNTLTSDLWTIREVE